MYRYFEEFQIDPATGLHPKGLGTRLVAGSEAEGRLLGYAGIRSLTITEPLTLTKGHKTVTYKASAKRPLRVRTMLQILGERHGVIP